MGLDKELAKRFEHLEAENKILRQEISQLKSNQNHQNPVRRGLNVLRRTTTLGKIHGRNLYIPSNNKIHPLGPRFRKRGLL